MNFSGSWWKWGLASFGGLLVAVVLTGLFFDSAPSEFDAPLLIQVPQGASINQVGHLLEAKGVIRSKQWFRLRAILNGEPIRAGYFRISPQSSARDVVRYLARSKGTDARLKVVIPEGFRIQQIARRLVAKGVIPDADLFVQYCQRTAKSEMVSFFPFLRLVPVDNLEGYLFPDTYFFWPDMPHDAIVRLMLAQFSKRMLPIWEKARSERGDPKKRFNFHQVVTLASIIEKEAQITAEMPMIASVFYNRLKKRQPLASDPTIVYALGLDRKRVVYYKDLKVDSPYNTYRRSGFPPTPIASPGTNALNAAVAPAVSPYFFFVADRKGAHIFTKTYAEHLRVQRDLK